MSFDRFRDGEDVDPAPRRELGSASGPVRSAHRPDHAGSPGENADLGRAVGELASENADLYKRVDYLERQLTMEKDRFGAWAREMAWREETLKARLERLEHAASQRAGPDAPERRVGETGTAEGEKTEHRRRGVRDDTAIVGLAVGGLLATAGGVWAATTGAVDAAALAAGGLSVIQAGIPWWRKHKEDQHADRPQR